MGILGIPNELLLLIGEYLSIRDLYHFLLTCRRLNSILNRRLHKLGLQDIGKQTALQWAAERGHASLVERAISGGAEIDKPDRGQSRRRPLHSAARNNHLGVVRILVKNKARISIRDSHGMTPLHYASPSLRPLESHQGRNRHAQAHAARGEHRRGAGLRRVPAACP